MKENRLAQQHLGHHRAAARRGIVEEVLWPRDQLLVIDRRVEKGAVRLVGEARDHLVNKLTSGVEIMVLVHRFVRERESQGYARVILEQTVDLRVAQESSVRIDA